MNLRDSISLRGRRPEKPWGVPDRVWWLAQSWELRMGLQREDAIRLASLYHVGSLLTPSLPAKTYERTAAATSREISRGRVVVRLNASPDVRKRIEAGLWPNVRWVDGVGGVAIKPRP